MADQRSLLPVVWELPPIFRQRIGAKAGRQRSMFSDGHLLLVLHAPPGADDVERRGRFFWRKTDGSWVSNDLGSGVAALGKHLSEYSEAVQRFDRMEEAAQTAAEYFAVLEGLAPLHRAAANLHAALQEARKQIPDDRDIINLRDQAYEIERNAELLYNNAKNALDFAIARRAEEESRSSRHMAIAAHRLNMLAAFFLPLATLSAVFGVNLIHGWEDAPGPVPFLALIAAGLVTGGVLATLIGKSIND